ncbi:FKBP-type peptidyl-prolyl cis-trans isomerase [Rhodohalobacter sp. 614A]|uniref:FKBP-type peptidyl-prolyl cis-trans isomerase n=1 Tax=Rhodohalobacter sp. 614A TaxID=2908649 RepID=UPI001F3F6D14|nr:FKBP-type peptidyl-prolyl cis-trans isomerase [Rhodohalobacter sp. 614A]
MKRSALLPLFAASVLVLSGPNESCDDHDRQANTEYLQQNAQNEDVTETDSGLQYRIIETSDGPVPAASDSVRIDFVGRFIDGTIFDTTSDLPNGLTFKVENFTLDGVREGILLMEEGATYEFVVPSNLGFGETTAGDICPGTTLIFELSLVEIF